MSPHLYRVYATLQNGLYGETLRRGIYVYHGGSLLLDNVNISNTEQYTIVLIVKGA